MTVTGRSRMAKRPSAGRRKRRTEHQEQTLLFEWIAKTCEMQTNPKLALALQWTHAIPNGFYRSPAMRGKAKREGVKAGILDVFVPAPEMAAVNRTRRVEYAGFYIEMKVKGRPLRDEQKQFMDYLSLVNYRSALCFTWQDAAREMVKFLGLTYYAEIIDDDGGLRAAA